MSNERRIKKHIHGKPQRLRVTCAPGLEDACARELQTLMKACDENWTLHTEEGAVVCRDIRYSAVQFLLPRLRTASRVYLRIGKQRCTEKHQFQSWLADIKWELYLPPQVKVKARSFKSALYHEGMMEEMIGKAIAGTTVDDDLGTPQLLCTVRRDEAVMELDLAGRHLSQRDYKEDLASLAPLKAHVAYACIDTFHDWIGTDLPAEVTVPFAGSGTLGFEYAMHQADLFPGLWRKDYGIQKCPFFKPEAWQHYLPKPQAASTNVRYIENSARQVEALRANCKSFGHSLDCAFTIDETDVFAAENLKSTVIMNPPYGDRLAADEAFFRRLGEWIQTNGQPGFALLPSADAVPLTLARHALSFRTGGKITHMLMWKNS